MQHTYLPERKSRKTVSTSSSDNWDLEHPPDSWAVDDLGELGHRVPLAGDLAELLGLLYGGSYVLFEDVFAALRRLRGGVDQIEREIVRFARFGDATWEEIGEWLGLTRQGAHARFRATGMDELDELDELHETEQAAANTRFKFDVKKAMHGHADDDKTWAGPIVEDHLERQSAMMRRHTVERQELVDRLRVDER